MLDKTSLSFDMNNLETMSSGYVYNDSSMAANYAYLRFEMENECTRNVYSKKNSGLTIYQFSQEKLMCIAVEYIMACYNRILTHP